MHLSVQEVLLDINSLCFQGFEAIKARLESGLEASEADTGCTHQYFLQWVLKLAESDSPELSSFTQGTPGGVVADLSFWGQHLSLSHSANWCLPHLPILDALLPPLDPVWIPRAC